MTQTNLSTSATRSICFTVAVLDAHWCSITLSGDLAAVGYCTFDVNPSSLTAPSDGGHEVFASDTSLDPASWENVVFGDSLGACYITFFGDWDFAQSGGGAGSAPPAPTSQPGTAPTTQGALSTYLGDKQDLPGVSLLSTYETDMYEVIVPEPSSATDMYVNLFPSWLRSVSLGTSPLGVTGGADATQPSGFPAFQNILNSIAVGAVALRNIGSTYGIRTVLGFLVIALAFYYGCKRIWSACHGE